VFRRRKSDSADLTSDDAGELDAQPTSDLGDETAEDRPQPQPHAQADGGPWDATEAFPEQDRVDLGCLWVPVGPDFEIQLVMAEQQGAWVTARHGESELQMQAFAASRSDSLWDDVRAEIAAEVDAVLVADIAHIAGLIAGGAHPSPVGFAPVITTTTHKTLRGPRGAMIMTDAAHATAVDKAVFPGLQGGPHNHTTAAIAVALREAAQPSFRRYAAQVVANAVALASALQARGYDLVSGGTDNHLLLVDLTSKGIGGKPAAKALDKAGIELNFNAVPYDTRRPFDPSGIRLGTPAITTRGLTQEHMPQLAAWMDEAITAAAKDDEAPLARIASEIRDLLSAYPIPGWIE